MIHLALVIDEYGSVQGLVSSNDLLEALVGDLPSVGVQRPVAVQREDESWLMDGRLPIHEINDLLQLENIFGQEQGRFHTLGAFVIEHMRRIPVVTDHFRWRDLRFEIVDMDGNRIDKVL